MSYNNTFVHRLDPRAKLIATLLFLFTVISFSKYEIAALLPFFLYPMLLMTIGEIPFMFIVKKVFLVSPFAVFIGIFNPLLDSGQVLIFNGLTISAGWLSFFSIMLKFTLTVSTALLLIATTSFPNVCHALRQLGLPSLFRFTTFISLPLYFCPYGRNYAYSWREKYAILRRTRKRHQNICSLWLVNCLYKNRRESGTRLFRNAFTGVSGRHAFAQTFSD